jgi:hypothetical protein
VPGSPVFDVPELHVNGTVTPVGMLVAVYVDVGRLVGTFVLVGTLVLVGSAVLTGILVLVGLLAFVGFGLGTGVRCATVVGVECKIGTTVAVVSVALRLVGVG